MRRGSDDPLELGRVTDRRPPFKYSALTRVWFSDTDAQGINAYEIWVQLFERAYDTFRRQTEGRGIGDGQYPSVSLYDFAAIRSDPKGGSGPCRRWSRERPVFSESICLMP